MKKTFFILGLFAVLILVVWQVNFAEASAGTEEFKPLGILTRIEENLPEESQYGIETAKDAVQNRLIEAGEWSPSAWKPGWGCR